MQTNRFTADPHLRDALSFTLVFTIPLSVLIGHFWGGWGNLLTPLPVFGRVPLLDSLIGCPTDFCSTSSDTPIITTVPAAVTSCCATMRQARSCPPVMPA